MSSRALPPAKLLAVVAPVSLVGVGAYLAATFVFLSDPGSTTVVLGVGAFLLASMLTERFPVPVEGADANGVSLGFVFAVAALVLFGWAPATFVYVTAPTVVALIRRNPPIRTLFNAGAFGLVGSIAGWVLTQLPGASSATPSAGEILIQVSVTAAIVYTVNLLLVTAAISASGSELGYFKLIRSNVRWTIVPFTLMASTALMLVVLWQRTPFLFAALAGPLVAISLYQRSTHKALERDPPRAHRPAHGARQPPPLPRAAAARARARRRARRHGLALLPRHRRLQAGQRPVRASGRRPHPLAGVGTAPPGRRVVPARRRRVRGAAPGPRRAAGARHRALDRRSGSPRPSSARPARSRSAPASRPSRSTDASATR